MKYLFGTYQVKGKKSDTPEGEQFLLSRLPASLTDVLAKRQDTVERAARRGELPLALIIVKYLCLSAGFIITAGLLKGKGVFSQGYRNAPYLYWICGLCLLAGGVLWMVERSRKKHLEEKGAFQEARKALREAEHSAESYLSIPQEAKPADVLALTFRQAAKDKEPRLKMSLCAELRVFRRSGTLCVTDGESVYGIPCSSFTGLRLVEEPVPFLDWNKEESPDRDKFKRCGLVLQRGEPEALRFFCALEWTDGAEAWRLAFPAWELSRMEQWTGLKAPKLPDWKPERKGKAPVRKNDWKLRPFFYWTVPKGESVAYWMSYGSDVAFKLRRPKLYGLLVAIGLTVFFVPWFGFPLLEIALIPGAIDNGWTFLGMGGGFLVGVGLFNIVGAWLEQYLGHWVTILCLVLGGAMMAASWLLLAG